MVGSHEVETQQSVDVYLSLPHTLYMYIANLSKANYSNHGIIIRKMIAYIQEYDLSDEINRDEWICLIDKPVSQDSIYIRMPDILHDFIIQNSKYYGLSKTGFIRHIVNYFYQNNAKIGVNFNE